MKTRADLVRGWLLKAESDLANARLCLEAQQALDTVCFHAQQAAEKSIKAYLTAQDMDFPFIHNLEKLVELCAQLDPAFSSIKAMCQELLTRSNCATTTSSGRYPKLPGEPSKRRWQ